MYSVHRQINAIIDSESEIFCKKNSILKFAQYVHKKRYMQNRKTDVRKYKGNLVWPIMILKLQEKDF